MLIKPSLFEKSNVQKKPKKLFYKAPIENKIPENICEGISSCFPSKSLLVTSTLFNTINDVSNKMYKYPSNSQFIKLSKEVLSYY